jgi:hypothetical protein
LKDDWHPLLEVIRGIADNYIDSQKEIINLFQHSTWMSRLGGGNEYATFWSYWMSTITKGMTEAYANTVSSYIDNIFAATKLMVNLIYILIWKYQDQYAACKRVLKDSRQQYKNIWTYS